MSLLQIIVRVNEAGYVGRFSVDKELLPRFGGIVTRRRALWQKAATPQPNNASCGIRCGWYEFIIRRWLLWPGRCGQHMPTQVKPAEVVDFGGFCAGKKAADQTLQQQSGARCSPLSVLAGRFRSPQRPKQWLRVQPRLRCKPPQFAGASYPHASSFSILGRLAGTSG